MKKPSSNVLKFFTFLVLGSFVLAGCADTGLKADPTYKDKVKEDMYKNGSLVNDKGGFSLFGGDSEKTAENTGLGVNGFLWRAALDTLAFLPIASADPFGGVITTDWHSTQSALNERVRLNVLILDRDLRADGVKVTVFRQTKDETGQWVQAPVAAATGSSLEDTILSRARQLKLAQKTAE